MKKTILLLGLLICIVLSICVSSTPLTLYINQSHSACDNAANRATAASSDTPWCSTSSSVMDKSIGNDTVLIATGIYSAKLKLRNKDDGIILKPAPNNNVILTNSHERFYNTTNHTWTNISTDSYNMWVSDVVSSFNCLYGFYNATNESFYPACEDSTYCTNAACTGSPNQDFDWWNETLPYNSIWHNNSENKTYIKFTNDLSINPNNLSLWIGNDFTITLENIDYEYTKTEISNFTINSFDTGIYFLANSENVTIENNDFVGCGRICTQVSGNSGNVTIQKNNGNFKRLQNWTWTYEHDIANNFIWLESAKDNIKILNNNIIGYGNGIVPRYLTAYGLPINDFYELEIAYNTFKGITDDAIEPEDYANCYNIHHNNITDVHVVLTLTPSNSSTCFSNFTDNIGIANMSQDILNGSTMRVFKFSSGTSKASGWNILRNTLQGDNATIQSAVGSSIIQNFTFRDNIIYGTTSALLFERTGTPIQGNLYDYNLYYNILGGFAKYWSSDADATEFADLAAAKAGGNWNSVWDANSFWGDPVFETGTQQPLNIGAACLMSSTGSYVGALPCSGTDTGIPTYTVFQNNASATASVVGSQINISLDIADNVQLDFYVCADNQTGTLTNGTFVDISGTSYSISHIINITQWGESNVSYNCWMNDTSGNTNTTILDSFLVAPEELNGKQLYADYYYTTDVSETIIISSDTKEFLQDSQNDYITAITNTNIAVKFTAALLTVVVVILIFSEFLPEKKYGKKVDY